MDPISLIETALVAGATTSVQDTTNEAIKDAYTGLKVLLQRLFTGKHKAEIILSEHETDPETYEKPLKKLLAEANAGQDVDLLNAAEYVMRLLEYQQENFTGNSITNSIVGTNNNNGNINNVIASGTKTRITIKNRR